MENAEREELKYVEVPVDGQYHAIWSESLLMKMPWEPKRHPDPPQQVRAVKYEGGRYAVDAQGWIYYRYDYPYGWVPASHIEDAGGALKQAIREKMP